MRSHTDRVASSPTWSPCSLGGVCGDISSPAECSDGRSDWPEEPLNEKSCSLSSILDQNNDDDNDDDDQANNRDSHPSRFPGAGLANRHTRPVGARSISAVGVAQVVDVVLEVAEWAGSARDRFALVDLA
jgi:hypothetical protein